MFSAKNINIIGFISKNVQNNPVLSKNSKKNYNIAIET